MFRNTQLRIVALVLVFSFVLLPVSLSAAPSDGPRDDAPRFEERALQVQSFWQRVAQALLNVGSAITPNGHD